MKPFSEIPAPRPVTEKVQRLSVSTLAECDAAAKRFAEKLRAEFEARADEAASREFGSTDDATIL